MPKAEFLFNIKLLLNKTKKSKNAIIAGDFNCDILSQDILDQEFLQVLLENGYHPGFKCITRPSNDDCNKGTCIDNLYIKLENKHLNTYLLNTPFNDHYPLIMSINSPTTTQNSNTNNKINYHKLPDIASSIDWHEILTITDPNQATNKLINKLKHCISLAKINNSYRKNNKFMKPRKSWITKALLISCKTKEKLYNIWKKDPNNQIKKDAYKNYVKTLDRVIHKAKENNEKAKFETETDPKRLWLMINEKLGRNTSKRNDIKYIVDKDRKITDQNTIAENMNKFFCNVGKDLSNKITQPLHKKIKYPEKNPNSFFLQPTNMREVQVIISKMKKKNGGIDGINAKVIKTLATYISEPLTYIINLCIDKEIWPDALKEAEIKPIYKGQGKTY